GGRAERLGGEPTGAEERGLMVRVTAAASSTAYHRERGRSASAATSPAAPITPARWIDGPAPVTGTYMAISNRAPRSLARSVSPSRASRGQERPQSRVT